MRRVFLITIACLLTPAISVAQGSFLARGADGYLIGGDAMPADGQATYSAEAGYSYRGTADVGFAYQWMEVIEESLGLRLDGRNIEPRFRLHILKQGSIYPISISAVGSYGFSNLEVVGADTMAADVTGRNWSAGGLLQTVFPVLEKAGFRPWVQVAHVSHSRTYPDPGSEGEIKISNHFVRYSGGLQLVLMPTDRSIFFVGPEIRLADGERISGLSGGLVFN